MRRTTRLLTGLALAVMTLAQTAPAAVATFTSSPSSQTLAASTATLAPPSGLAAGCFLLTPTTIRLTWTVTPSTWADGYEVFRSTNSGGPYTSVGTVSGRSTTTVNNTRPNTNTYYYVLQATKGNWRSINSNQAQTPGICIL